MSGLREWFSAEMQKLGFAGLEGVYDYIISMTDTQVEEYLESLLGSEQRIVALSQSFVRIRKAGIPQADFAANSGSQDSTSAQSVGQGHVKSASNKKKKRNRGKAGGGPGKRDSKSEQISKPSFANAVSRETQSLHGSAQADAIQKSPAEQARQRLREYRKTNRAVNCIRCGKIEKPIREDGACSFCQSPIFSMWEGPDRGGLPQNATGSSRRDKTVVSKMQRSELSKAERTESIVLGRHVHRNESGRDASWRNIALQDIAGRDEFKNQDGTGVNPQTQSLSLNGGYYRNPFISTSAKQASAELLQNSMRDLMDTAERNPNTLPVTGRLLVEGVTALSSPMLISTQNVT